MRKIDLEPMKSELKAMIQEEITNGMEMLQSSLKMHTKVTDSKIESLSGLVNLMSKEFNLKIGALKGHETRRSSNNEDILAEFETVDEFYDWMEARKKRLSGESTNVEPIPSDELLNR